MLDNISSLSSHVPFCVVLQQGSKSSQHSFRVEYVSGGTLCDSLQRHCLFMFPSVIFYGLRLLQVKMVGQ